MKIEVEMQYTEKRAATRTVEIEVPDDATEDEAQAIADAAWEAWADALQGDPMHPDWDYYPSIDGEACLPRGHEWPDPPPPRWDPGDDGWHPWPAGGPGEWSSDGYSIVRRDWPHRPQRHYEWRGGWLVGWQSRPAFATLPAPRLLSSPAVGVVVSPLAASIPVEPTGWATIGGGACTYWLDEAGALACVVMARSTEAP